MRYLTKDEIIEIHKRIIKQTGGSYGLRNINAIDAAINQPRMTFEGDDLYPTIIEKAATLAYSIILNHPRFPAA